MGRERLQDLQVRKVKLLPDDLSLFPKDPPDLYFADRVQLGINLLFGYHPLGSRSIGATPENALKAASFGSGYEHYLSSTGTTGASYGIAAPKLFATTGRLQKFDILVEGNDALGHFYDLDTETYGDDIVFSVGFYSIEFLSAGIEFKDRVAGANAVISATGYY